MRVSWGLRAHLFIAVVAALCLVAPAARAQVARAVSDFRLANGLRVVVSPDPASADVSVAVRYDVGARDDPSGLTGLAHLSEHLMCDSTKHVPLGQLRRLLERAGATNINGETAIDWTLYHETLPPDRLDLALWLESDRMGYQLEHLDEAALVRDRAAVLNEYRDRVTDVPRGRVGEFMSAALFPSWHPYHHDGGTPASINAITLSDVRAFLGTWYGPANATLVVAGNVQPATVAALAARYFGALPARRPPVRPTLPALDPLEATVLHVEASVTREEVVMGWVTPPFDAPGDVELDLVAAVLTAPDTGWLTRRLVADVPIATRVASRQSSKQYASVFTIEAVVAPGHTTREVIGVIDDTLARFEASMTAADVQRAERAYYNARLFSLESSFAWCTRIGSRLPFGPLPASFDGGLAKYAGVSPEAVRRAARAYLDRSRRVVLMVHPARYVPVSGVLRSRSAEAP
jgi:predicted Zn-dependent peptidase